MIAGKKRNISSYIFSDWDPRRWQRHISTPILKIQSNCLRFDGLDPNTMYTIHIATELEGKTVVQVLMI